MKSIEIRTFCYPTGNHVGVKNALSRWYYLINPAAFPRLYSSISHCAGVIPPGWRR